MPVDISGIEPSYENALEHFPPTIIGPLWQTDDEGYYLLPEYTLGWDVVSWAETKLNSFTGEGKLQLTNEQRRLFLWYYAIDEYGEFVYDNATWQAMKGLGKDPTAAVFALVELCGPVRFSHWGDDGQPVGKRDPLAWCQLFAVSKSQVRNTASLFPAIISKELIEEHNLDVQKEIIYGHGGQVRLEVVGSSAKSAEGNRVTWALLNEALALDTPIPTPSGWTVMGDLQEGDIIYGSAGQPTRVSGAHEVQYDRDSFRVTFDDGSSLVASDGHWWKVRVSSNRDCSLHQMTTRQMHEAGREFYLPESFTDLRGEHEDLPIDPYYLGLWLGDGSSRNSVIAVDEQDAEETLGHLREIEPYAHLRDRNHIGVSAGPTRGANGSNMQSRLRAMGLIGNKHIPAQYLRASWDQRLELLRGLMDSDGSIRQDGRARFANTSQTLLSQTRELLISLGYHVKQPHLQSRTGAHAHWLPLGQISFTPVRAANPFKLKRKADLVNRDKSPTRTRLRKIVNIEPVESVPVRCISVEAEDQLFLAGEGMHATRNTQHWTPTNGGKDLYEAINRNARKVGGRFLCITNAYQPGEGSVAQEIREGQERVWAGLADGEDSHLYMSVEAHPDAPMAKEWVPHIIRTVCGDAHWIIARMRSFVRGVLDPSIGTLQSRRYYYNQIATGEDALFSVAEWDGALVEGMLGSEEDLKPKDEIVLGFDGSRTDDATALVAIRIRDKLIVPILIEQKPFGPAGEHWRVDEALVDEAVKRTFATYEVRAFYADRQFWESYIDAWSEEYGEQLEVSYGNDSKVSFDMRGSKQRVSKYWEAYVSAIVDGRLKHNGNKILRTHALNARRGHNGVGLVARKEKKDSPNKIDAMVASYAAYAALTDLLEKGNRGRKRHKPGRIIRGGY